MDRQIIYYYQRGVASYLIAKKFGVSNNYVRNLLKKHGIPLRGHNITNKLSADRRTPEENQAITRAASEANLGSTHTQAHRTRIALSREKKPTIDPVYEKPLIEHCLKSGVKVIPQKAFYKYNVDLYLPEQNIVIEIFGGGFHNKKDAVKLFNNKIRYLSKIKVPVVIVWADKLTYSPSSVLEACLRPTGQLTIITGEGKPTNRGMGDIIL